MIILHRSGPSFRHFDCSIRRFSLSFRRFDCSIRRSDLSFRRLDHSTSIWSFFPSL
ncbi:hypothetical protein [Lysinibacillus sp. fls2-241-R2A-57]|uniref:hypothetical protein n=1 Tax=Lysinibacillus sp. fls2-241-R2A-57 TaxID=3040292 RepID=UPI00255229F5|nr:hypothetical protein [Lysinibacillus sp. fls2-241-R2A-57]